MAFTTTSDFTNEIISDIENKIGYRFTDKDKLVQAFVRSSSWIETNNEILEFLGDSALSLVIAKKMSESYIYNEYGNEFAKSCKELCQNSYFCNWLLSDYTEGEMTEIKKTLVSTGALSAAITNLNLSEYLVMSAGDIKSAVDREPSVREDLFEAIVGAIAIDSGWNTDRLTEAVDAMLGPDPVIAKGYQISEDYVGIAAEMVKSELVYEVEETDRGYEASVNFNSNLHFSNLDIYGFGKTEEGAKQAAAKKFIEFLKMQRDILKSLDGKNPGECVSMLNELYQKNIIKEPEYRIICLDEKSEFGNTVWRCYVNLDRHYEYTDIGCSKQEAKNHAAMRVLCSLLPFEPNMSCYATNPEDWDFTGTFADLIKEFSKEIKI